MSGPPVNSGEKPTTTGDETPKPLRAQKLGAALDAVNIVSSGYQTGAAGGDPSVFGLASAGYAGYSAATTLFAAGPVGAAIGVVLAGASYLFGHSLGSSKARREAKRSANLVVQAKRIDAIALPYCYGYNRVIPIPVYISAGHEINYNATTSPIAWTQGLGDLFGADWGDHGHPKDRKPTGLGNNSLSLQQFDLCAGRVSRVIDAVWRGQSIRDRSTLFAKHAFVKAFEAGSAGDFAQLFVPTGELEAHKRTANTTFLNKSHLDGLFWQWYRSTSDGGLFDETDVQWDDVFFFGDKLAIPVAVTANGVTTYGFDDGAGGTHSDPSTAARSDSRNVFAVAADYLLNPDKGPRGITVDDIDMRSLHEAFTIGNTLYGAGAAGTARDGTGGVAIDQNTLREQCREIVLRSGVFHRSEVARSVAHCMTTLGRGNATGTRFDTGISGNSRLLRRDGLNYEKRRFQFDGEVPSDSSPAEGLSTILQSAPGALQARDNRGKLRFDVPDTSIGVGDAGYVQGEITDDHLLAHPAVKHPRSTESANSVTVTFPNAALDLHEDQIVAPTPGSALANALVALDGEEIPTEITLDGVIDPELAHSAGLNYLMQRRRPRLTFVTTLSPFRFVEGCRVRLHSEASELDMVVRILTKQVVNRTIVWSAIQYDPVDYDYHPDAIGVFAGVPTDADDVPAPVSVSATYNPDTARVRVNWIRPSDLKLTTEYHVARAVTEPGEAPKAEDWVALAVVPDERSSYSDLIDPGRFDYRYRVRGVGARGGLSAWVESETLEIADSELEATRVVRLQPGECPPDDEFRTGDTLIDENTGTVYAKEASPYDAVPDAAWDSDTKTASIDGHSIQIGAQFVYTRGARSQGVAWSSGDVRVQYRRIGLNDAVSFRPNRPTDAIDADLLVGDPTGAVVSWFELFPVATAAGARGRFAMRVPGPGGPGSPGPQLKEVVTDYALIIRWEDNYYRIDFDPIDLTEQYVIGSQYIPDNFAQRCVDLYASSLYGVQENLGMALVNIKRWPHGTDWSRAFEPIPLANTLIGIRGEAMSGAILGARSIAAGSVVPSVVNRVGFRKVSDDEFHIGLNINLANSVFRGTVNQGRLAYIRCSRRTGTTDLRNATATVYFTQGTDAPEAAGPLLSTEFDSPSRDTVYAEVVIQVGDNTPTPFRIEQSGTDYVLPGWFAVEDGLERGGALYELFGTDLTAASVKVALLDERRWLHGRNWPLAFEPDVQTVARAWQVVAGEDAASPVTWVPPSMRPIPDWTGRNLKMVVLDAMSRCLTGDHLSLWARRVEAQIGDKGDDGRGYERVWTVAAKEDELTAVELPPNTIAYDAGGTFGRRVWTDEEQETTFAQPFSVHMIRSVPGLPAKGDLPTDEWGVWAGPYYRKTYGKDPVQIVISSGLVVTSITDKNITTQQVVRVKVAVIGGGQTWTLVRPPDPTPLVEEEDVYDWRDWQGADNDEGPLTHPDTGTCYDFQVTFTTQRVPAGQPFTWFTRAFEIHVDVDGERHTGVQHIQFVAFRDGSNIVRPLPPQSVFVTDPMVADNDRDGGGNSAFTVRWVAAPDVPGATVTGWIVEVFDRDGNAHGEVYNVGKNVRQQRVLNIPQPRYYEPLVWSVAGNTRSANPTGTSFLLGGAVGEEKAGTKPNAPTNLRVDAKTATSFRVNWTAGPSVPSAPVTGFEVRLLDRGGNLVGIWNVSGSTNTRATVTGLTSATSYAIEVRAISNAAKSDPLVGADTTASVVPNPPVDLSVSILNAQMRPTVSWTPGQAVAGATVTAWEIEIISAADPVRVIASASAQPFARSRLMNPLTDGTEYRARVRALAGTAASLWYTESFTATADPNPPLSALTFSLITGDGFVKVTRTGTLDPLADGWEIQFENTRGGLANGARQSVATTAQSSDVTGLVNGTTYWFRVRAISTGTDRRNSQWSQPQSATPSLPGVAALGALSVSTATSTENSISVTRGSLPTGADGWELLWGTDSAAVGREEGTKVRQLGGVVDTITVRDRPARTNHYYRVRAISTASDYNDGPWSTPVGMIPTGAAASEPFDLPVLDFELRMENNQFVIDPDDLDPRATTWQYQMASTSAGVAGSQIRTGVGDTAVWNHARGTQWHVRVRQTNPTNRLARNSAWSAVKSLRVVFKIGPLAKTITPGSEQFTIQRGALPSNATFWQYRYAAGLNVNIQAATVVDVAGTTTDSATVTGLTNGTVYFVQVRANTSQTNWEPGDWSPVQSVVPVVAGATQLDPITLTASSGDGEIVVTRGSLPTGATGWKYKTAATAAGLDSATYGVERTNVNPDGVTDSVTIAGVNGTEIWSQAIAHDNTGNNLDSAPSNVVSAIPKGKVGALTFTAQALNASIRVRRGTLPANAGGWRYRWRRTTATAWDEVLVNDTTTAEDFISNLVNGASYAVSVRAVAANPAAYDDGDWSLPLIRTPNAPALPAPTALTVTGITSSGFTVGWTASASATAYTVAITQSGQSAGSFQTSGTSQVVTGLSAGTTYDIAVRARSSAGTSPPLEGTATTLQRLLPVGLTLTNADTTVTITRGPLPPGATGAEYRRATSPTALENAAWTTLGSVVTFTATRGSTVYAQARSVSTNTAYESPSAPSQTYSLAITGKLDPPTFSLESHDGRLRIISVALPSGAGGWQYRYGTSDPPTGDPVNGTGNNAYIESLQNNTEYFVQLRSTPTNAARFERSDWSASQTATPGAAGSPLGALSATLTARTGAVRLTRGRLPSGANGWEYRQGTLESTLSSQPAQRVTGTFTEFVDITTSVTRYAQVRAYDSTGARSAGRWSAVVSATPELSTSDLEVQQLRVTNGGLTHTIYRAALGEGDTGWHAQRARTKETLGDDGIFLVIANTDENSTVVSNLTNEIWWWRVRSIRGENAYGPWSDAVVSHSMVMPDSQAVNEGSDGIHIAPTTTGDVAGATWRYGARLGVFNNSATVRPTEPSGGGVRSTTLQNPYWWPPEDVDGDVLVNIIGSITKGAVYATDNMFVSVLDTDDGEGGDGGGGGDGDRDEVRFVSPVALIPSTRRVYAEGEKPILGEPHILVGARHSVNWGGGGGNVVMLVEFSLVTTTGGEGDETYTVSVNAHILSSTPNVNVSVRQELRYETVSVDVGFGRITSTRREYAVWLEGVNASGLSVRSAEILAHGYVENHYLS